MKLKTLIYISISLLIILTGCQGVGEKTKKNTTTINPPSTKTSPAENNNSLETALEYYNKGEILKAKQIFEKIEENDNIEKSIRDKAGEMIDKIEAQEKDSPGIKDTAEDPEEKPTRHKKTKKRAASSLFKPIPTDKPVKTKARQFIKQGDAFFVKGSFDEALTLYLKALEENPKSGDAYIRTGDIFLRKSQYDKSGEAFKKALEINPNNKYAHFGMADILMEKGDYNEAEKHLNKCLQIDNKFAPAYTTIGDLYVDKGNPEKAEEAFLKSLRADPLQKYPDTYIGLGELYFSMGKLEKSLKHFRKAQKKDPFDKDVFLGAAKTLIRMEKYQEADKNFQNALQLAPDDIDTGTDYIGFCIGTKRFDKAEKLLQIFIEKNPNDDTLLKLEKKLKEEKNNKPNEPKMKKDAQLNELDKLLRNGSLSEAEILVNEIIKEDPKNSKAYFYRGVLNQKNIEFAKALEDYQQAVKLNPKDALCYAYMGRLLIVMRGGLKEATECFGKALEIDPNNREAQMGVGMTYMFTEEYPKAKAFFDKLLKSIPDKYKKENADLFQERGFAHYYVRDFPKALEDFNTAIKLDPDNLHQTTNYAGRAMTYHRLKKLDEAVKDIYKIKNDQEIVTLHSEYDEIIQVIYYHGDLQKAFNVSRLAYKAFPCLYADVLRYGEMLDRFGKIHEARKMFKRAMELDPANIQAYERMAYSFKVMGDIGEAEKYLQLSINSAKNIEKKIDTQLEYIDFLILIENYKKAEEKLKKIVNLKTVNSSEARSQALLLMAKIKCFTGKKSEAEILFNKAVKINEINIKNNICKADILIRKGKLKEALAKLNAVKWDKFEMTDDAYDIDMKKAEIFILMNKNREALKYLKKVFEKDYPSTGLFRLRFVIPKSPAFEKMKKHKYIKYYLNRQNNRIFEIYKSNGNTPKELPYESL